MMFPILKKERKCAIPIKSYKEIALMKEGGKILSGMMIELKKIAKPGTKTIEIEEKCRNIISKKGVKSSFLGFDGYPAVVCTSINEEIVHALPSERVLKEGDILSIDIGIKWKGYHTDMAITIPIGKIDLEAARLLRATKKALKLAIKKARVGNTFGDVGNIIQRHIEGQGFNVVRDLCGHGIGKSLHELPQVLNFGKRHKGDKIKEGMVFCIEPMASVGDWRVVKAKDGFGYKTRDNSLSCHFEHTIAVTKNGPIIITE